MKYTLTIAFLLKSILFFGQDATLEETLTWIKGKIESQEPTWFNDEKDAVMRNFTFNYEGCEIEYSYEFHLLVTDKSMMRSKMYDKTFQKVNLKNIEVVDMSLSNAQFHGKTISQYHNEFPNIYLRTLWGQNLVKEWEAISAFGFPKKESEATLMKYFKVTHKEAERLKKAFEHAMKLCDGGPKKEKF